MKQENNENEEEMIYYVSCTAYITSDAHNSLKPPSLRVKQLGLRSNFVSTNVTFFLHKGILWDVSVHIKNTGITIISTLSTICIYSILALSSRYFSFINSVSVILNGVMEKRMT